MEEGLLSTSVITSETDNSGWKGANQLILPTEELERFILGQPGRDTKLQERVAADAVASFDSGLTAKSSAALHPGNVPKSHS